MPEQDAHRQQANSEAGCRRSRNPASSLKRFDIRLRREPSSSTLGEVEVQSVQQFHGGPLLIDGKPGIERQNWTMSDFSF